MYKPAVGSVVGSVDENHWGQVLLTPSAYGVLEIDDPDGNARTLGIEQLTKLNELLQREQVTIEYIHDLVWQEIPSQVASVVLILVQDETIHILVHGEGAVYLRRGSQFSCLIKSPGVMSGTVHPTDVLLLVTRGFNASLSIDQIGKLFGRSSVQDIAEKLTLFLHEQTSALGSAALVLQLLPTITLEETEAAPKIVPKIRPRMPLVSRLKALLSAPGVIKRFARLSPFRHNRKLALVTLFFTVLFIGSVAIGLHRELGRRRDTGIAVIIAQAQRSFDEGSALLDLNPVQGRERLKEAKSLLEPVAKKATGKTKEERQATALHQRISDNLTQAMHVVKAEPGLFYDAALLKSGAKITDMFLDGDSLIFLDGTAGTVATLKLSSKRAEVVGGGEAYKTASQVTSHGGIGYVLTTDGITSIDLENKTVRAAIIKKDDQWGIIADVASFGGNIYLLDTKTSRIWKYVSTGNGFSELREYLNPDTLPDLTRAAGMVIDGSVWTGTTDGKMLRFTQGKENTYTPQGVEPALGTSLVAYTSDEAENLYVLDEQNKRVVVLGKDGVYLSQYTWSGNFSPSQLIANEKLKKIFLLAQGKLYSIDIQ